MGWIHGAVRRKTERTSLIKQQGRCQHLPCDHFTWQFSAEKLFQSLKYRVFTAVMADGANIFELHELLGDLLQSRIFIDQQPDTAARAIADRQTANPLQIVGTTGEQADNV